MNNRLVSFQRVTKRLGELSDGFLVDEVQGPFPIIGDLSDTEFDEPGLEDSVFVSDSFCEQKNCLHGGKAGDMRLAL
jgi:hypothetical protein